MLGLRYFTQRLEKQQEASPETLATMASASASLPWGLLVAIGIDILIDGLLLGIGFAAGAKEGPAGHRLDY
jgi:ZIP family zinc transporter